MARPYPLLAALLVVLILPAPSRADSCTDTAKSQPELNDCAAAAFKRVDGQLNALYKKILSDYADDAVFVAKFKAAQRAWLTFRDAEMAALFPHADELGYYGSIYPMCNWNWMEQLTRERIAQLRKWSQRTEEGDACAGSIKIKE